LIASLKVEPGLADTGRMNLRRSLLVLAAILAASLLVPASSLACPTRPAGLLVPSAGMLLGAYVNPNETWLGLQDDEQKVTTFESMVGRRLDIDMHFYQWDAAFPTALEQWDATNCRVPMISWAGTRLDDVNSGGQDKLICARARAVAQFGQPVFIRWGYEMNGDWFDWTAARSSDTAAAFVAAWRRIHRIFEAAGARNATWVWAPNETALPTESWRDPRRYYPGDDVVDWVGIDGYNWGSSSSSSAWRSFSEIFTPVYAAYAARKPIMIAETASTEDGGSKATWIDDMNRSLSSEFPQVRALVWFHSNKETDWRVDSSPAALDAFRRLTLSR